MLFYCFLPTNKPNLTNEVSKTKVMVSLIYFGLEKREFFFKTNYSMMKLYKIEKTSDAEKLCPNFYGF